MRNCLLVWGSRCHAISDICEKLKYNHTKSYLIRNTFIFLVNFTIFTQHFHSLNVIWCGCVCVEVFRVSSLLDLHFLSFTFSCPSEWIQNSCGLPSALSSALRPHSCHSVCLCVCGYVCLGVCVKYGCTEGDKER